jgi:hypothetical protein
VEVNAYAALLHCASIGFPDGSETIELPGRDLINWDLSGRVE